MEYLPTLLEPVLIELVTKHPVFLSVLLSMSVARLTLKPVFTFLASSKGQETIQKVSDVTPWMWDNKAWAWFKANVMTHWSYKSASWILDYSYSIKLKVEQKQKSDNS